MSNQQDEPPPTPDEATDDHADVGKDPKHPHPQDRPWPSPGEKDDDSPVDRYRDSPGLAVADEARDAPEPNEPA